MDVFFPVILSQNIQLFQIFKNQIFSAIFGFSIKIHLNKYKQALVLVKWFLKQSVDFVKIVSNFSKFMVYFTKP